MTGKRDRPWLYEQDGDLNPTWLLVALYAVIGLGMAIAAVVLGGDAAKVAALSFVASSLMAFLISALPRDKAKILAKAKVVGDVAKGISDAAAGVREFGARAAFFETKGGE